jgi:hypothetical protein
VWYCSGGCTRPTMTDSPNTLKYGRKQRPRWRRPFTAFCIALALIAGWYFRAPIREWVNDAEANWKYARLFDSVQRELVSANTYWLASPGAPGQFDRADQLLAELLAQQSPGVVCSRPIGPNGPSKVLFVRAGTTAGQQWLGEGGQRRGSGSEKGVRLTFSRFSRRGSGLLSRFEAHPSPSKPAPTARNSQNP